MNFRRLDRKLAPFTFLPLLLSALTGIAYRVGNNWFDLSDRWGDIFLSIHEEQ
jgi:hypothetical protein